MRFQVIFISPGENMLITFNEGKRFYSHTPNYTNYMHTTTYEVKLTYITVAWDCTVVINYIETISTDLISDKTHLYHLLS